MALEVKRKNRILIDPSNGASDYGNWLISKEENNMAEDGAFLSAFLRVLLDRLASCDFIRIFSQRNFDHGLRNKLRTTLLALQLVLDDAEDKQITNKSVKAWLQELQHVFHQADDLLDEISTKALRDKLEEVDHDLSQTQSSISTKLVGFSQFFRSVKQSLLGINPSVSTSVYF
ncbi:uncharacterized protein LOC132301341 [Cornus florida]|uniref:uncharacterized protein LOC132301341 n=1 Tax=Cornus florida TaxID=4283 RepID=UPI002896BE16|nr:uncharacterized protein LOC132301341 [Cornus florida]